MGMKPGYKHTEVGVIPDDWKLTAVGNEFSIQLGKMLDAEKNTGALKPYLGNRAVQWGRIDLSEVGLIKLTSSDLKRFRLRKNDLLVCEGGDIGRAAIWHEPIKECYYQKALHRLRPKSNYNVQLMLYILQHLASKEFLRNYVTQTSIAHLPKDKFETVPIPLPPTKTEQEAIAKALSDADALIESLEQLIAKKRQIKLGAMQVLLTGKRRLPGFEIKPGYKQTEVGEIPDDWCVPELGNIGRFKNGINKDSQSFGHGSPFLNLIDVFGISSIESSKNFGLVDSNKAEKKDYNLQKGDVIFVRSSVKPSGVGLTAVIEKELLDTVYSGFLIRFRDAGHITTSYKRHCFFEEGFRARVIASSSVSANTNINQNSLATIAIPIPPTHAEQEAIATILTDMDTEITALETKLSKARQIKQGMMQELLTGRIRLV